jgi:hypothetical protein
MSNRLHDVRQPRSSRPSIADCARIYACTMQAAGAFVAGEHRRGELIFPWPDGTTPMLTVRWEAYVPETAGDGWIEFQHPDQEPYRLGLTGYRYRPRGLRWMFVDPTTGRRHLVLYCPIGRASRFASRLDHHLRAPSDSDSLRQRPMRRLQRMRARLAALVPDDGRPTPNTAKIDRLREDIATMELKVLTEMAARLRKVEHREADEGN